MEVYLEKNDILKNNLDYKIYNKRFIQDDMVIDQQYYNFNINKLNEFNKIYSEQWKDLNIKQVNINQINDLNDNIEFYIVGMIYYQIKNNFFINNLVEDVSFFKKKPVEYKNVDKYILDNAWIEDTSGNSDINLSRLEYNDIIKNVNYLIPFSVFCFKCVYDNENKCLYALSIKNIDPKYFKQSLSKQSKLLSSDEDIFFFASGIELCNNRSLDKEIKLFDFLKFNKNIKNGILLGNNIKLDNLLNIELIHTTENENIHQDNIKNINESFQILDNLISQYLSLDKKLLIMAGSNDLTKEFFPYEPFKKLFFKKSKDGLLMLSNPAWFEFDNISFLGFTEDYLNFIKYFTKNNNSLDLLKLMILTRNIGLPVHAGLSSHPGYNYEKFILNYLYDYIFIGGSDSLQIDKFNNYNIFTVPNYNRTGKIVLFYPQSNRFIEVNINN